MDARRIAPWMGMATLLFCLTTTIQGQNIATNHVAHSPNFIVFASTPQMAAKTSEAAERLRSELAIYWLGQELPPWPERCPIHVYSGPKMLASGITQFTYLGQRAGDWSMKVYGTEQRVLDSVLPHEITHTVFATHFARYQRYVPRWADEGACTTVEHEDEKVKHRVHLQRYLRTGKGLPFNTMFSLKDYPADPLPLYAQSHSVVQFLLDQAGPRNFMKFIERGIIRDEWEKAAQEIYQYETLGEMQLMWNNWLRDGSPQDLASYAPLLANRGSVSLVSNATTVPASSQNPVAASGWQPANAENLLVSNEPLSATSNPDDLQVSVYARGKSWYRDRFHEINGVSKPSSMVPVDQAGTPSAKYPLSAYDRSNRTSARPQPSQSTEVQVLDWGRSQPIAGLGTDNGPVLR